MRALSYFMLRKLTRLPGAWLSRLPLLLLRKSDRFIDAIRLRVEILVRESRFAEADSLLGFGLTAWPDHSALLVTYALVAHNQGLYLEAARRWRHALEAGAFMPICFAGLSANLRETGEVENAQAVIEEGLRRFADDNALVMEAARVANSRHLLQDALSLWRKAISMPSPHPDSLQGCIQTLVLSGAFDEAKTMLDIGRARFPNHRGLDGLEGALAIAREDWSGAIAHWTEFRRRYPEDAIGWQHLGIAVQGARLSESADESRLTAGVPAILATIEVIEDEPMRHLMLRFESIGDSCEFGLVQRRYAAEPLSLLRWNEVRLDQLLAALEHRFEGMGTEANTELVVAANGEYFVKDRRWSLGMHTFLYAGQANHPDVFKKMCRRVVFLRDKLITDLTATEKIFVYRSLDIDGERLAALHRALCAFGHVTLLGAQPINMPSSKFPGARSGEILQLDARLFIGFLERPGSDTRGNWDIAFEEWASICQKAADATQRMPA